MSKCACLYTIFTNNNVSWNFVKWFQPVSAVSLLIALISTKVKICQSSSGIWNQNVQLNSWRFYNWCSWRFNSLYTLLHIETVRENIEFVFEFVFYWCCFFQKKVRHKMEVSIPPYLMNSLICVMYFSHIIAKNWTPYERTARLRPIIKYEHVFNKTRRSDADNHISLNWDLSQQRVSVSLKYMYLWVQFNCCSTGMKNVNTVDILLF